MPDPTETGQSGFLAGFPESLDSLTAISPLDGRYREKVLALAPYTSEMGLIQTRFEVEALYLIALSEVGVVRPLSGQERETLEQLGPSINHDQAIRVKEIEQGTRHDVKAMERAFREFVAGTSLADVTEKIHIGLTSEDVNNLSYRLMLDRARRNVTIPTLDRIVDGLVDRADQYKGILMIARTHGQAAVPTTLGKEMVNFAYRLNGQVRKAEAVRLMGKLNGAVGNYNAHTLLAPDVDWVGFSQRFVRSLGLDPIIYTTQISPYEDMVELFQSFQRVNGVLIDFNQDMWRYISDNWLVQAKKSGEVGSSTMTQKINPIQFENSEGNLQVANGTWETLARKFAVSRLQRDLSDSTVARNIGVGLAHGLLAYESTLEGLSRVSPNAELMRSILNNNFVILTEGVQTLLRQAGVEDPYTLVATLSRGQKIGPDEWIEWVNALPIENGAVKDILRTLTPESYIGLAERLTEMAIANIAASRQKGAI